MWGWDHRKSSLFLAFKQKETAGTSLCRLPLRFMLYAGPRGARFTGAL